MWVFVERLSHPLRLPVVYGARLLWVFVERLSLRCASVSKTTHLDSPHCLCALVVGLAVQTLLRLLDSKILVESALSVASMLPRHYCRWVPQTANFRASSGLCLLDASDEDFATGLMRAPVRFTERPLVRFTASVSS